MLPSRSWVAYEGVIKALGERRTAQDPEAVAFLQELLLVDGQSTLTAAGADYFRLTFLTGETDAARTVLGAALAQYPPAAAICQLLAGVSTASRATAETALRSQGFGDELNDRKLGSLLMLMHSAGMVKYVKRSGAIEILCRPASTDPVPRAVFVSPDTPYSNKLWLRRALEECSEFIWWLDKHFMPVAFESLLDAADARRISENSHPLPRSPGQLWPEGAQAVRRLEAGACRQGHQVGLARERLAARQPRTAAILGRESARNVPNVTAIYSGQNSEMITSDHGEDLRVLFTSYWDIATDHILSPAARTERVDRDARTPPMLAESRPISAQIASRVASEDHVGVPFVGTAGRSLGGLLNAAGLDRANAYVTNTVKCQPPADRRPTPIEIRACRPYLDIELSVISPQVLVALGVTASRQLVDVRATIAALEGRSTMGDGIERLATYHPSPSSLNRAPTRRAAVVATLAAARQAMEGAGREG